MLSQYVVWDKLISLLEMVNYLLYRMPCIFRIYQDHYYQ